MIHLIFIALLAIIPSDNILVELVDIIELNHVNDAQHNRVFDQIIYWERDEKAARHQIVAWRMFKSQSQIPRKNWVGGGWVANWRDAQGDVDRCVMAASYRVTYTTHDPELVEREYLPKEKRRELMKPRAKKGG